MSLIALENITAGYGAAPILNGVSLSINTDQIGVVVGPNGAGKSTSLKAAFGLVQVSDGAIKLKGEDITNKAPDELVHKGMGFVPQEHNIFVSLSVHENLQMGAYIRTDDFSDALDQIYDMFPPLKEKRHQPAGELSGGQRQMVAMGRALMSAPKLLLLDEPSAGLSPRYVEEIFELIINIKQSGVGILMVEQNARQALEFADVGFVLVSGENRFTDTGQALLADPEVAQSFLGG